MSPKKCCPDPSNQIAIILNHLLHSNLTKSTKPLLRQFTFPKTHHTPNKAHHAQQPQKHYNHAERITGMGCASVFTTYLSRGNTSSGEKIRYKYLKVSASKKLC